MGSLQTYIDQATLNYWIEFGKTFWIIPAGMVALYFYGRSRFNTPNYAMAAQEGANLLTLAPPIFTTLRSRFNRFALWYILILEIAFLVFIFLYSLVADIAPFIDLKSLPSGMSQTVQHRALWALFCLTGLFSSFPGFKDVDAWILQRLHQAALIPDDARMLAKGLFEARFEPDPKVAATVKEPLVSRDLLRVVEGVASGTFEDKVFKALCLLNQLQQKIANSKYNRFKVLLEKDLDDIKNKRQILRPIFMNFLKEQESIVPDSATDIDQYLFERQEDVRVAELIKKRNENLQKCDDLLYRLCLVVALLVYATKFTPETVGRALSDFGFDLDVKSRKIMDWDAVLHVTGYACVIMLGFNALFAVLVYIGLLPAPAVKPSRLTTLVFTLVGTALYFIILMVAIKSKKFWHRDPELYRYRPENVLVGFFCYLFTLPILIPLSWWFRGELTYAPFLFAINQGVTGYFIGAYIDRSLHNQPLDWRLAAWQGLIQAATAFSTIMLVEPTGNISDFGQIETAVYYALESGVAGFLIGYLFQYYYRRTRHVPGAVVGDISLQVRPVRAALANSPASSG